jgi:hypothetical protein
MADMNRSLIDRVKTHGWRYTLSLAGDKRHGRLRRNAFKLRRNCPVDPDPAP